VAAAVLAAGALWLWKRRKRRRRVAAQPAPVVLLLAAEDLTPRDQIITWAEAVRGGLVARFGDSWRAKTTEEIALDESLVPALGEEEAGRLVRFLNQADRAKFGTDGDAAWSAHEHRFAEWETWVPSFLTPAAPNAERNGH
jgi:hypothetical protein